MKTIMLAWESDPSIGDQIDVIKVAKKLSEQYNVVIASFNPIPDADIPPGVTFEYLPTYRTPGVQSIPLTLDALYAIQGLGDTPAQQRAFAWYSFITLKKNPALVVTMSAPHAQLFTYIRGLPTVVIGSASTIPPSNPLERKLTPYSPLPQDTTVSYLLTAVNSFLASKGKAKIGDISDLWENSTVLATSFSVMDFFSIVNATSRDLNYIGTIPIDNASPPQVSGWTNDARPKIFVYADYSPDMTIGLLSYLVTNLGAQVVLLTNRAWAKSAISPNILSRIKVLDPMSPDLAKYLPFADGVISNGSERTVASAIKFGSAIYSRPFNVTQRAYSALIEGSGAGIVAAKSDDGVDHFIGNLVTEKARASSYALEYLTQPVDPLILIRNAVNTACTP